MSAIKAVPGKPSNFGMFMTSSKIGMLAIGGGLSGWMFREYVHRLQWVDEKEFLGDLGVARVLPGTNVTNMTVILGYRLLGLGGAVSGFVGLLLGPFILLIAVLNIYDQIKGPLLEAVLQGAAAGALGPVVYLTYRSALFGGGNWYSALVLAVVAAAAILKISLIIVVALALPPSIALVLAFRKN